MLATGQRTYALGHYWEGPEQFGTCPNSARRGAIIVRALAGRKTARTGAAGRGIPWPRPVRPIDLAPFRCLKTPTKIKFSITSKH